MDYGGVGGGSRLLSSEPTGSKVTWEATSGPPLPLAHGPQRIWQAAGHALHLPCAAEQKQAPAVQALDLADTALHCSLGDPRVMGVIQADRVLGVVGLLLRVLGWLPGTVIPHRIHTGAHLESHPGTQCPSRYRSRAETVCISQWRSPSLGQNPSWPPSSGQNGNKG